MPEPHDFIKFILLPPVFHSVFITAIQTEGKSGKHLASIFSQLFF